MRKIIVMLLTVILVLGTFVGAFSASAATKEEDVIAKVSTSAIYKYIAGDIANLSRTIDATPEQLDQLADIVDRFVALNLSDKGPSADKYTSAEIKSVLNLIDEAAAIFGYTYTLTNSPTPHHKNDVFFTLFDADGKKIYSYEGDAVKKTGPDQTALFVLISMLGCGLLAGAVVAAKSAKRKAALD